MFQGIASHRESRLLAESAATGAGVEPGGTQSNRSSGASLEPGYLGKSASSGHVSALARRRNEMLTPPFKGRLALKAMLAFGAVLLVSFPATSPTAAASAYVTTSSASIQCIRYAGVVNVAIGLPRTTSSPQQYAFVSIQVFDGAPGAPWIPRPPMTFGGGYNFLLQWSSTLSGSTWTNFDGSRPTNVATHQPPFNAPQHWYKVKYTVIWADGQSRQFWSSNMVFC
jgi:hypothetical protein